MANPRMVTDHLLQIKVMDTLQVPDTLHLHMVNLPHQVTIPLHLKATLHRLQGLEPHHRDIHMDNMVLLAAVILHHLLNIIKDMGHLQVVMVNTDPRVRRAQVIKYPRTRDQDRLLADLQDQVSIRVTIKGEDIHLIHKEDPCHQAQALQVLLPRPNDEHIYHRVSESDSNQN